MFRAVIFDWRGTLVTTLTEHAWVHAALARLHRDTHPAQINELVAAIRTASGQPDRLEAAGVDSDAGLHRSTYLQVFRDAGLDDALASALYDVESDAGYNSFAADASATLRVLTGRGLRVAVCSDIHFDIRPAFAAAGMAGLVDVFTLSFEQGMQKPDPLMFTRTLQALGVDPAGALLVGDRSGPDGAAVEQGVTTLLLPPLRGAEDRRLHLVLALCPASP